MFLGGASARAIEVQPAVQRTIFSLARRSNVDPFATAVTALHAVDIPKSARRHGGFLEAFLISSSILTLSSEDLTSKFILFLIPGFWAPQAEILFKFCQGIMIFLPLVLSPKNDSICHSTEKMLHRVS